jgi:Fic family protein
MNDDNWDLINGSDAHDIEVLNYSNQINVIEALFRLVTYHGKQVNGAVLPNTTALRELHHAGTLFLLEKPGAYRTVEVHVGDATGNVVFQPPPVADVAALMEAFDNELIAMWPDASPPHVAAFVLWRINWIHPFKNGNGRTARAFAYACLCLKYGLMLPGTTTVIDLITQSREDYEKALRIADQSFKDTGTADLSAMEQYLERLAILQLQSAPIPD